MAGLARLLLLLVAVFSLFGIAFAILPGGEIKIFAVTENEEGMTADLFLSTMPGNGAIAFITSNSLVGKDTQTTGNIALEISSKKTGVDVSKTNFIFDIRANASEVDGPSAGAAMTLLAYSVLSEKPLASDVGITGTINTDGSIGVVGGVYPKAKVAASSGIKLLMIPKGEANQVIKENGKVTSVNLLAYGPDKLGMKIIEVSNVDEALMYAYSDIASIKVDINATHNGFVPEAISYKSILSPMKEISGKYIDDARAAVDEAKRELEATTLDDPTRSSFYPQLGLAERNIEMSKIFLDQNYLYSAANYSFNASVLAGTITEIAKNPSLLTGDSSSILLMKISSLESEIAAVKEQMDYLPLDKVEWIIGAQQRLSYAQNSLNKARLAIQKGQASGADSNAVQGDEMFDNVYDFVSAGAWVEVAKDFMGEAQKAERKKGPYYSPQFIRLVTEKMGDAGKMLADSNASADVLEESARRYNAAEISFDNNFFFAALYDAYFAESFMAAENNRKGMDSNAIISSIRAMIGEGQSLTSIWGSLYIDHAKFYLENSEFSQAQGQELESALNIKTGYDLAVLSAQLEEAKAAVDEYLAFASLPDYSSDEAVVGVTYRKVETFSPYFAVIVFVLVAMLLVLIFIGVNMRRSIEPGPYMRAEKLHTVLFNLDRALSKKKITDAEYFFMKKKYEDELGRMRHARPLRSKGILGLEESRAKLRALEAGLKDLKKHYKAGVVLPEDYDKHAVQVRGEIEEIRASIIEKEREYREARRPFRKKEIISKEKKAISFFGKISRFLADDSDRPLGTEGLAAEEAKKERADKAKRKKLLGRYIKRGD